MPFGYILIIKPYKRTPTGKILQINLGNKRARGLESLLLYEDEWLGGRSGNKSGYKLMAINLKSVLL